MTDRPAAADLWTLATWLSPGYPVGAYSYSHGLEWAVQAGDVRDRASLTAWVGDCLELGAGRTDAILLVQAMRAGPDAVAALAALALALAPSRERLLEQTAQGAAFAQTTAQVWGTDPDPWPYPIAIGRAAAARGIPADLTVLHYLHGFVANCVSAAVRLVPLGQTDGQRALAALGPRAQAVAAEALTASLDDIGGCAWRTDIAAMRHETQYTRVFRS